VVVVVFLQLSGQENGIAAVVANQRRGDNRHGPARGMAEPTYKGVCGQADGQVEETGQRWAWLAARSTGFVAHGAVGDLGRNQAADSRAPHAGVEVIHSVVSQKIAFPCANCDKANHLIFKCYKRFDPAYMGEEKFANAAHSYSGPKPPLPLRPPRPRVKPPHHREVELADDWIYLTGAELPPF
jgi:hypothetical protein